MSNPQLQAAFIVLFLAFHACNARHIDVIRKDNILVSQLSKKIDKSSPPEVSHPAEAPRFGSNKPEAQEVKDGSSFIENKVHVDDQKSKYTNSLQKNQLKIQRPKAKDSVQFDDSFTRVPRKLPMKKLREQQQDFNLDYDPPDMHPPEHN